MRAMERAERGRTHPVVEDLGPLLRRPPVEQDGGGLVGRVVDGLARCDHVREDGCQVRRADFPWRME